MSMPAWSSVLALVSGLALAAEPTVPALPPASEITTAERSIRQLYKDEYKSVATKDRAALMASLAKQANDPANNAVTRIALLCEAARMAGRAQRCEDAIGFITTIGRQYREAGALQAGLLEEVTAAVNGAEDQERLAHAAIDLAQEAMAAGSWGDARQLLRCAEPPARSSKSVVALKRCKDAQGELSAIEAAATAAAAARKKIAERPADADAKSDLGRWLCFFEGDWTTGLPLLAAGGDSPLTKAAKADLAASKPAAEEAAARAEAWIAISAKEASARARQRILDRALTWQGKAVEAASGLARVPLEKRLKEVQAMRAELTSASGGSPADGEQTGDISSLLAKDTVLRVTFTNGGVNALFAQGTVPIPMTRRGKGKLVEGVAGQALHVENDAFSLAIPDRAVPPLSALTCSFWLNIDGAVSSYASVIDLPGTGIGMFANHGAFITNNHNWPKLPTNQWLNFISVMDYKAKHQRVYLNGRKEGEWAIDNVPENPVRLKLLHIGTDNKAVRFVSSYSLDELVVYSRGLSENEVRALHASYKIQ